MPTTTLKDFSLLLCSIQSITMDYSWQLLWNLNATAILIVKLESDRVLAFNGGEILFSEGFRVLFIGVGGPDLAETSWDSFWHVSGPTRPTPPSFVSIWRRFEVISNPSRNGPIELKLGRNNLYLIWKPLWKFGCIWICGFGDMIGSKWRFLG